MRSFPRVGVGRAVRRQPVVRLGEGAGEAQSVRRMLVGTDNLRLIRRSPELACASRRPGREEPDKSFVVPGKPHNPGSSDRRQIAFVRIAWPLVDISLDLELFASDSVSLVPVYLGQTGFAALQPDPSYPLPLSPAATAIELSQSRQLSDGRAGCNGFCISNVSDDRAVHQTRKRRAVIYCRLTSAVWRAGASA